MTLGTVGDDLAGLDDLRAPAIGATTPELDQRCGMVLCHFAFASDLFTACYLPF
jgi:hypothetical protein